MRPLKKTRPLRHVNTCRDCRGKGTTKDMSYELMIELDVPCEGCDGTGKVGACDHCDAIMAITEAELNGYVCAPCLIDAELGDQERDRSRIGRWCA